MRAALLAILMLGCGASLHDQPDLSESVRLFNEGVRWERFTAAASALPPRDRAQFVDDMDQRSGDVKITEYEVLRVDPRGAREARVQVKLSWYKTSEGTIHETHAVQTCSHCGGELTARNVRVHPGPGAQESSVVNPEPSVAQAGP